MKEIEKGQLRIDDPELAVAVRDGTDQALCKVRKQRAQTLIFWGLPSLRIVTF
jgi:hypothetical protein